MIEGQALTVSVNDEQLLQLALAVESQDKEVVGEANHKFAESIIVAYCIDQLGANGSSFTEDDIAQKYKELVVDYALESLVSKGLLVANVDKDGETRYSNTELGKKLAQELKRKS